MSHRAKHDGTPVIAEVSRTPVGERIATRLTLLETWNANGMPPGYLHRLPSTLAAAARWEDEELGIQRIVRPNDIVRTHKTHGPSLVRIEELLRALHHRYRPKQMKKSARSELQALRRQYDSLNQLCEKVASQYRTQRQIARDRAQAAHHSEQLAKDLERELRIAEAKVAELTRELRSLQAIRKVPRP